MNIVLIGMRGSGKSKISRRLCVLTKRTLMSTDTLIPYESDGQTIPQLVSERGWHHFRDLEYRVTEKLSGLEELVVDCGGGIIVDLDSDGEEIYSRRKIDALKRNGFLVWLKGDIPRLAAKVRGDVTRPSLSQTTADEELMRRREPFYARAADLVIDIEGKKRKTLALEVYNKLVAQGILAAPDKG